MVKPKKPIVLEELKKMDKRTNDYTVALERFKRENSNWQELLGVSQTEDTAPTVKETVVASKPVEKPVENKEPERPKLKSSKPWLKKDNVSKPWRRDYFKIKAKRPGYVVRFVNKENVERRLDMGYEIADPKDYEGFEDRVIDDGSPLGKRMERRGMVVMEIPQDGYEWHMNAKRERIKALKRSGKEAAIEKAKRDLKKAGVDAIFEDGSKGL